MKRKLAVGGVAVGLFLWAGTALGSTQPELLQNVIRYKHNLAFLSDRPQQQTLAVMTLASAATRTSDPALLSAAYAQAGAAVTLLRSDTSYSWDGSQWLGQSRSTYSYDAGNHQTSQLYETYGAPVWSNYYQTRSTYDGNGRISTDTMQLWQSGAWVNQSLSTYTYDVSGNLSQVVNEEWTGSQWGNTSRITFTYSSGRMATSVTEVWSASAWLNWSKGTYTYDGGGNLTELLAQTWQSSAWVNQDRTTSTYNGAGDETESVSQLWQSSAWVNVSKHDYTYDGSHQQILDVTSNWITVTWFAMVNDTMKYAGGKLTEKVTVEVLANTVSRTDYSYDSDGNKILELSQDWDMGGGQWVNVSREVWVYAGGAVSCCIGMRGNINLVGIIDLSDLSALISYLTGYGYVPPCPDEANVNGAGIIDLSDLSGLISYLTGGGYVPANCP